MNRNITAVIVAYQPNLAELTNLATVLALQCYKVIIVDNSEPACLALTELSATNLNIETVSLGVNLGIGAAQNTGIKKALCSECEGVVLFDQDSSVANTYIEDLWCAYIIAASSLSKKIAAVGPNYTDIKQAPVSPFVKINGLKVSRVICTNDEPFVDVDCLIASGCLLIPDAIHEIGFMREDLFIDYVDTEWCLRAKNKGYHCVGACAVEMQHSIGDNSEIVFGRRFTLHSPLRHYYLMRNAAALYLYSDLQLKWKLADAIRLICKFFVYALLGKPRSAHLTMMIQGLWHGATGRMGRL